MPETSSNARPPAYRVETERLLLRCWSPSDAPKLRALLDNSDQHLRPYIPWMRDEPRPVEATAKWLRNNRARFDRDEDFRYAIFSIDGNTLIGETGLYTRVGEGARELGYLIGVEHTGFGYATEAGLAMVKVAFEVDKVERVELHCSSDNEPSQRIAKKLGFALEATLPRRGRDSNDHVVDQMIWTLFDSDYQLSPSFGTPIRAYDCIGELLL